MREIMVQISVTGEAQGEFQLGPSPGAVVCVDLRYMKGERSLPWGVLVPSLLFLLWGSIVLDVFDALARELIAENGGQVPVRGDGTRRRHVVSACDANPCLQCESGGLRARGCTQVSEHDAVGCCL